MKKGEIYYADLNPSQGSEQGGIRPVLILQNDLGNKHSPTTIVAPITSKTKKTFLPVHVPIASRGGLPHDSCILCEQIRTIGKHRLMEYVGELTEEEKHSVKIAVLKSFDYLE